MRFWAGRRLRNASTVPLGARVTESMSDPLVLNTVLTSLPSGPRTLTRTASSTLSTDLDRNTTAPSLSTNRRVELTEGFVTRLSLPPARSHRTEVSPDSPLSHFEYTNLPGPGRATWSFFVTGSVTVLRGCLLPLL
jgi:hypothetical protein